MSTKIPTLLAKIDSLPNTENAAIILDFYKYMQDKGSPLKITLVITLR